jgi:hypothetical protein
VRRENKTFNAILDDIDAQVRRRFERKRMLRSEHQLEITRTWKTTMPVQFRLTEPVFAMGKKLFSVTEFRLSNGWSRHRDWQETEREDDLSSLTAV